MENHDMASREPVDRDELGCVLMRRGTTADRMQMTARTKAVSMYPVKMAIGRALAIEKESVIAMVVLRDAGDAVERRSLTSPFWY